MTRIVLRGRAEAMSRALGALRDARRTGQGFVVVVSGEPGIGKTALLREIIEQATRTGFRVGGGKAEDGDQIAPGAPLLVALRSGPDPLLSGDAFASLAPLYDKPLWLVDRIGALLEELAAAGPVLVTVDDVQWADRLTRFALRVLPARLSGSPVVWLIASRRAPGEALTEILSGADDVTAVTHIPLGPLTSADIAAIATDRSGAELSPAMRELLDDTGGNPFWAVQIVDGLAGRPDAETDFRNFYAELGLGIRRRLGALSAGGAELVRLVAVWGRPLGMSDAAAILADSSESELSALAREAVAHGLLSGDHGEVRFPHDVLREAVYADIAPERRRLLHRACARRIVAAGGAVQTAVGHYRCGAGIDDDEAISALVQAVRDGASLPLQAVDTAHAAFALTTPGHRLWFLAGEVTVEALLDAQREAEALVLADRLRAAATDPETVARLELLACRALWVTEDIAEMDRRATVAMTLDGVSAVMHARLRSAHALAASRTLPAAAIHDVARYALAEAERLGDLPAQRLAVVASIEAARNEGRHTVALELFADLRRLSDDGHLAEEIRTLQHLDRFDEADAMLTKIREAVHDVDRQLPSMLYAQMWQDLALGQFDAVEAGARTLIRLTEETGNHAYRLNARMVLAVVAAYRDEIVSAVTLLRPGAQDQPPNERRSARLRLVRGWLSAATGDYDTSLALLAPLLDTAGEYRDAWPWSPPWMRILASIGLLAGDTAFAARAGHLADLAAQRNPGVASLQGAALHIRALLGGDAAVMAEAVAVLRESPRPMLVADALRDLGSLNLDQGSAGAGVAALTEAAEIYHQIGAVAGTRTVSAVLRRHGVHGVRVDAPSHRPDSGWESLTPTELRVVGLISAGHTNRSAATALSVSPNTVNTHLRSVFRKLGVRSRVQLTNAFREHSGSQHSASGATSARGVPSGRGRG